MQVIHREGETEEEFKARIRAAAPPLSEEARAAIRSAGDEYWMNRRGRSRERRRRERRRADRRRVTLWVAVERRTGERRIADRRTA